MEIAEAARHGLARELARGEARAAPAGPEKAVDRGADRGAESPGSRRAAAGGVGAGASRRERAAGSSSRCCTARMRRRCKGRTRSGRSTCSARGSPELRSKASGLIRQVLADPSPAIRAQAIRALGTRWVSGGGERDRASAQRSRTPRCGCRRRSRSAGSGAKSAAPALAKTLSDEDRSVRFVARVALAKLGEWDTSRRC